MPNILYEENDIQDIAEAIREQNGGTETYTVSEMGDAIRSLGTPIDSSLSETSTNPIQNKVVTVKFNQIDETVNNHKDNEEIHTTNEEKEIWNNKSDFSGKYEDLTGKPTIPEVPSSLKNPYALTFNLGGTTYTYDGSKSINITIEDGSEVGY